MAGLFLDQGWRGRVAVGPSAALLAGAWFGDPPGIRAAMAAAAGDLPRAAAIAAGPWQRLAEGDLAGALREARGGAEGGADGELSMEMALAEAEALVMAGAVASGLNRLLDMHRAMYATATVALARHRHRFGDHTGAVDAAMTMPGHAQAAILCAKAALMENRAASAIRSIEPFLSGVAPVPDAMVAGALATLAASALARMGRREELERLASGLLGAGDLDDEIKPAVARVAWTAGRAREAWSRFKPDQDPWSAVARLELALLAGEVELATRLSGQAGPLGVPSLPALNLLKGGKPQGETVVKVLADGRRTHVWRTHPTRWAPWIDAAKATGAKIELYDLAAGNLPDESELPEVAMDDSALLELVEPRPVPVRRAPEGVGVWVEPRLCAGFGIGHDWPRAEDQALAAGLGDARAKSPDRAAVLVLSAETALAVAASGRPALAVAPPGDPFWAGPLPERAWPAMLALRADPSRGWAGAGERAARAALDLAADVAGAGKGGSAAGSAGAGGDGKGGSAAGSARAGGDGNGRSGAERAGSGNGRSGADGDDASGSRD